MASKTRRQNINKGKNRKTKKQKKQFQESKCSPLVKRNPEKKPFSCYTDEQLFEMKELWNSRHPDAKIDETDSKEIWKRLRDNMSNVCNRESCWLKQNFAKNEIGKNFLEHSFAPKSPDVWKKNPTEWLTSVDIANVMNQYEKAYPFFEFIGPSPIDFDTHMTKEIGGKKECVWQELCQFDLFDYMRKGKKKVGVIFNLDPHYLDGSHWVALFIDVTKKIIFFFDSNGEPVPDEVMRLVKKIKRQGKKHNISFKFDSNEGVEHQLKNTECGIYCLYFIIQLTKNNKTTDFFKKNIIRDDVMQKLRHIYFNVY